MNYATYITSYVTHKAANVVIFATENVYSYTYKNQVVAPQTETKKTDMLVAIKNVVPDSSKGIAESALLHLENKYDLKKLRKLRILLVEDNRLNVMLLQKLFSEIKMKLQVAENGNACIEMLKENEFDIVLMDLKMPVVTGYEATVIIRNDLKSDVPIIAMTGYETAGDRERCLGIGMNAYISKPVNANLLFEKIYELAFPTS